MKAKVLVLLGLIAVVGADQRPTYSYNAPQESEEYDYPDAPAKYDFDFGVKDGYSGADFAHEESRDEDETRGSYSVQLPDGRLQKVTYHVDGDNGYVAEVTYEGEAQFPDSEEYRGASRETYSAPTPTYSSPTPTYSAPTPTYSQPRPTYSAPRPSYSVPRPRPVYG